jgi:hypothetical protein
MLTVFVVTEVKGQAGSAEKTKVEIAADPPTLRDLIVAKVKAEVAEWQNRARRLFGREYLTENDIRVQKGPGDPKAFGRWEAPPVDAEKEAKKALDAFARDRFHVFFAERRVTKLDERVPGDRQIRVVRLSPMPPGG